MDEATRSNILVLGNGGQVEVGKSHQKVAALARKEIEETPGERERESSRGSLGTSGSIRVRSHRYPTAIQHDHNYNVFGLEIK